MKKRAVLLIIVFICLLSTAGYGQDLPSAEILTADAAWCELSNNLRVAEILITGEIEHQKYQSLENDVNEINFQTGLRVKTGNSIRRCHISILAKNI